MGTGIKDMIDRCRKAGLPEPEIRIDGGSWVNTVWRKKSEKAAQGKYSRLESGVESVVESWPESWPKTMANKILSLLYFGKSSKSALSERTGVTTDANSLKQALYRLLDEKLIDYTIPSKPSSRLQKYRLTDKGRALLDKSLLK